jgi:hypothetical protein
VSASPDTTDLLAAARQLGELRLFRIENVGTGAPFVFVPVDPVAAAHFNAAIQRDRTKPLPSAVATALRAAWCDMEELRMAAFRAHDRVRVEAFEAASDAIQRRMASLGFALDGTAMRSTAAPAQESPK